MSQAWASTICLYGPPGSGKSSVGRQLASALALPFWDLDSEIETRSQMSIPEIFAHHGEAGFRRWERDTLDSLLSETHSVIALGGGALLDENNRQRVTAAGHVLCLNTDLETLLDRIAHGPEERPLLVGDLATRLENLIVARAPHYASFPHQVDTTGRNSQEVAWEIQVLLGAFRVSGMGRAYPVRAFAGALEHLGRALCDLGLAGPVAIVSDSQVANHYGEQALQSIQSAGLAAQLITFPAGEAHKNLDTAARLWDQFLDAGLERRSTIVALGGGVTTDLAGFTAAAYLRGVDWVAVPTSLLAMVDASLGGKTGIDLRSGKNLVGAFHPPRLVLADPTFLATLPPAELRSGMAEVVKHGVLGAPHLFTRCAQGWRALQDDWEKTVRQAMAVKIATIQRDPYERGERAALNLGHTLGHAIEKVSNFQLRHGEAVAIGMVAAARLAESIGHAESGLAETIAAALRAVDLPTSIPAGMDRGALLAAMQVDKKRAAGVVRLVLPRAIGEVAHGVELPEGAAALLDCALR